MICCTQNIFTLKSIGNKRRGIHPEKPGRRQVSSPLTTIRSFTESFEGEVNAYELLLNKYRQNVLTIVKRHVPPGEIEEIAQTVFVRAYQSLPSFHLNTDFRKWISSIAIRSCHDYWRKAYRNREIPISALDREPRELAGRGYSPFIQPSLGRRQFSGRNKRIAGMGA